MNVELPFAPVDTIIRRRADGLRVSADAAEELARRIQTHGANLAHDAAERATVRGRKTLMAGDFGVETTPRKGSLVLPVAPIDRIARIDIDRRYRVSMEARLALAGVLEEYAAEVAEGATILARHAGRRTVQAADIETYFRLLE